MLTLAILTVAALFFYFGFVRPPRILAWRLKSGFVLMLALALFSGYFEWREWRSLSELAALIEPVPEITEVTYIPTSGEVQALADAMAQLPMDGRFQVVTQEERQRFAESAEGMEPSRSWILTTTLEMEEIAAFYADPSHRPGWTLASATNPWLSLTRATGSLTIFILEKGAEREILYTHTPTDRLP